MLGFENFTMSSWFDQGVLTRHVSVERKESGLTLEQIFKNTIAATSLLIGASISTATMASENLVITLPKPRIAGELLQQGHSKLGVLLPDGYWARLKTEMLSWEKIDVPTIDYPNDD